MEKSIITLQGFMASGKTTVGQLLAKELNFEWLDLDEVIEQQEQLDIASIFSTKGETYFRKVEAECLKKILGQEKQIVLSLGGGTPCFFENIKHIRKHSVSFFLQVGGKELVRRLSEVKDRPLLLEKTPSELSRFVVAKLKERRPFYLEADYTIMARRSPASIVKTIVKRLKNYGSES